MSLLESREWVELMNAVVVTTVKSYTLGVPTYAQLTFSATERSEAYVELLHVWPSVRVTLASGVGNFCSLVELASGPV